jgi:hypothetical protein
VDFHLVSEGSNVLVYQDMQKLKTKETTLEDGTKLPAPVRYGPAEQEVSGKTVDAALKEFSGYDVESVHLAPDSLIVRVYRPEDMPAEEQEPQVTRLKKRKGGAKK